MALSVRTRFEIFKRDDFTCRYCARKSPEVVLEVDHVVPVCDGGTDDPMNLVTACWECNSGKGGVSLNAVLTGEDPHDRAIEILETERQLREYNAVLAAEHQRRYTDAWELIAYWKEEQGFEPDPDKGHTIARVDYHWLLGALKWCPKEVIRDFMDAALSRGFTRNLKYVGGCVRNWRAERGLDPLIEPEP